MNLKEKRWALCLLALPFLLYSCGGGSDDPTPPGPDTEGSVAITPDVSTHRPGALTYHFYGTDATTPYYKTVSCPDGNFSGTLPLGAYRVIAVNPASGVEFRNMAMYDQAAVHLATATPASRADDFTMVSQPGEVYAVVLNEITVSSQGKASYAPAPDLLTQTLNLPFELSNGLEADVTAIAGTLRGVYPWVNLSTGTPASAVEDCENTAVAFTAAGSGAQRSARISLFGICDPKGGEAYTNTLYLTLTLSNGTTEELAIDLTDALTEAMAENEGSLPLDLEIPIDLERVPIGLTATVGEWQTGGESEKEMQN